MDPTWNDNQPSIANCAIELSPILEGARMRRSLPSVRRCCRLPAQSTHVRKAYQQLVDENLVRNAVGAALFQQEPAATPAGRPRKRVLKEYWPQILAGINRLPGFSSQEYSPQNPAITTRHPPPAAACPRKNELTMAFRSSKLWNLTKSTAPMLRLIHARTLKVRVMPHRRTHRSQCAQDHLSAGHFWASRITRHLTVLVREPFRDRT